MIAKANKINLDCMDVQKFQIYMMFDNESALGYPYIAVCNSIERYIYIDKEHTSIESMHKNDKVEFHKQYVATSRFIEFDLEKLDSLVESIIGQRDYALASYFNEEKKLVIAFRHRVSNEYKEYEFYPQNSTNKKLTTRINSINDIMTDCRNIAFG